jgi:hypothetical protein
VCFGAAEQQIGTVSQPQNMGSTQLKVDTSFVTGRANRPHQSLTQSVYEGKLRQACCGGHRNASHLQLLTNFLQPLSNVHVLLQTTIGRIEPSLELLFDIVALFPCKHHGLLKEDLHSLIVFTQFGGHLTAELVNLLYLLQNVKQNVSDASKCVAFGAQHKLWSMKPERVSGTARYHTLIASVRSYAHEICYQYLHLIIREDTSHIGTKDKLRPVQ